MFSFVVVSRDTKLKVPSSITKKSLPYPFRKFSPTLIWVIYSGSNSLATLFVLSSAAWLLNTNKRVGVGSEAAYLWLLYVETCLS